MRQSHLFGRTLRETPSEAELPSHRLLLRAGYIRQLMGGSYTLLPLGLRVAARIKQVIREELDAIDGQELLLPCVQPGDLWRESGRFEQYGADMAHLKDRSGRELVFAPTHEEAITDMVRREVHSYRQVPLLLYQFQVKFRDEARPRGGLLRVREFTMKDAYSFDADQAGLDAAFERVRAAYERVFARCGLHALAVEASAGMMGGGDNVEFQSLSPSGEDTLITCAACGYSANLEVARFKKDAGGRMKNEGGRMKDEAPQSSLHPSSLIPHPSAVATPECTTIEQLATFLGVPTSATAKAVFFSAPERGLVFAVVRGDHEVNEAKLAALAGVAALRPATAEEIAAVGAVPGYASPVGLERDAGRALFVVADDAVVEAGELVAGANRAGYHLQHVVYGRDWSADSVGDIALARAGDACMRCGAALALARGIEIGHIFKLGTRYSQAMGALYQDAQGQERPLLMGCYGIGVDRLLASVAELHHDERGLRWPDALAPFAVHLLRLGANPEVAAAANQLYAQLRAADIAVLYDDRDEAAGVKFADADLIGLPLRLVLSARSLTAGQVELKRRDAEEKRMVALDELLDAL